MIGIKTIIYNNDFPLRHWELRLKSQLKYVEYIVATRDMVKLGMPRKDVIKVISEIGQEHSYAQAENHLD